MVQTLSLTPIQKASDGNMGTILEALMKKKAEEAKNKQDLLNLENLQKVGSYFGAKGQTVEGKTEEEKKAEEEKKKGTGSKIGGAASGAMTGAKIGSVFGPVGTGVGAVIGGIGGWFS